ncbi:MAG: cobalamin biosynthesis protein [Acaryochloridaceae cyanobacterium SU_2_1]|nr:cobalamin biosynthesis protein [Acaryochloridaceae cyanobacterium SU_2_1]
MLDYLIGDPWGWPHPVQGMGWIIQLYTKIAFQEWQAAWQLRLAGIYLGITLIGTWGLGSWLLIKTAYHYSLPAGLVLETLLLASCFAGRSLRDAAQDVLWPLRQGDIMVARSRLRKYVGRDTEILTEPDILRAILETVAENTTDGVMAPLFYALVGMALPGIGPVPLAIAYKAASTLDSMIGYREPPYTDLGWFSARWEDLLTWLPCRLTVITLGFLSGRPGHIFYLCRRDAHQDPSPNSGWSECAFAAVLNVQLGGINHYRGKVKIKPLLGDPQQAITIQQIELALRLTRNSFLLWLTLIILINLSELSRLV